MIRNENGSLSNLESTKKVQIRATWYSNLRNFKTNILLFTWFSHYCNKYNIDYPFSQLNVTSNSKRTWNTLNNAEVIDIQSPLDGITFTINNTPIIATPFKSFTHNNIEDSKQSTKRDVKNIQCQNNYTN